MKLRSELVLDGNPKKAKKQFKHLVLTGCTLSFKSLGSERF